MSAYRTVTSWPSSKSYGRKAVQTSGERMKRSLIELFICEVRLVYRPSGLERP